MLKASSAKSLPLWLPWIIFAAFALILTYPLPLHLTTHLPRGAESAGTVPLFNLWTLQWNIDQLLAGYPRYWDAPIFGPLAGSFALSETQPLTAWLALPLWLHNAALGYNGVVLLFLTLNGGLACWLARHRGLGPTPAGLTGLLVQALPFVAQEMGVLQLLALFGWLWLLLYLSLFLRRPTPGRGFGLALSLPVLVLTCGYYALFGLILLPLALLLLSLRAGSVPRAGLACLLLLGGVGLVLPYVWQQRQHLAGFERSLNTITNNSARLEDYGKVLDTNLVYSQWPGRPPGHGQRLFPGYGLLGLALLGLLSRAGWPLKAYLMLAAGLAFLLSLGLRLEVAGLQPYLWLRETVPGLAQLRSPFRWAAMVQVHLALLAGWGLNWLGARASRPGLLLIAGLVILEGLALPLPLQAVPDTPWPEWVNAQPAGTRLVLLPFAASPHTPAFEPTTRWMLASRGFQGDMLNGYSGFFPADTPALREALRDFPTPAGLDLLRQHAVDYVLVYHRLADAPAPANLEAVLPVVYQDERHGIAVYQLDIK